MCIMAESLDLVLVLALNYPRQVAGDVKQDVWLQGSTHITGFMACMMSYNVLGIQQLKQCSMVKLV